jgi:hypothetical protein
MEAFNKMSKYQTNSYTVTFFDSYGRKMGEIVNVDGLVESRRIGEECLNNNEADSFTIHRCLFNSKDK